MSLWKSGYVCIAPTPPSTTAILRVLNSIKFSSVWLSWEMERRRGRREGASPLTSHFRVKQLQPISPEDFAQPSLPPPSLLPFRRSIFLERASLSLPPPFHMQHKRSSFSRTMTSRRRVRLCPRQALSLKDRHTGNFKVKREIYNLKISLCPRGQSNKKISFKDKG